MANINIDLLLKHPDNFTQSQIDGIKQAAVDYIVSEMKIELVDTPPPQSLIDEVNDEIAELITEISEREP